MVRVANRRLVIRSALALTALAVLSGPTFAHPHVWVTMTSSVLLSQEGLIEGVRLNWTFDDAYAELALEGLDVDGNGDYSAAELAPLTRDNIASLGDYGYFTFMRGNGAARPIGGAQDEDQVWKDGKLTMSFTVPLVEPIDPRKEAFELKIYDPEFFIAFDYASAEPVSVTGSMPATCRLDVAPVPTDAELNQTRTMLASKGKDWKPEDSMDFGSMFAQAVSIPCRQ
ncbi:MAG: DUF1007 family protein [Alphaproteobacteria bacterium]|nr:DUF1007 family protein [Alphaproteobacteria bacterium]